jgi:hypothetical protein
VYYTYAAACSAVYNGLPCDGIIIAQMKGSTVCYRIKDMLITVDLREPDDGTLHTPMSPVDWIYSGTGADVFTEHVPAGQICSSGAWTGGN